MSKSILLIGICFLLLAGCRQQQADLPRLVELDSLIAVAPDSAAALLAAYPDDSLRTDDDRAYHALLLTQAKYKAYIHAYSLDTINMAVAHYADGHDTGKRTRSLLYKGCVFEDLSRLDSAMYYYKAAEDHATQSGDTYHRGYALMRQASLFQSRYGKQQAIDCYRKALTAFNQINNGYHEIYCQQELGNLYLTINLDSAYYFIKKSLESKYIQNNSDYAYNLATLAAYYFIKQDYQSCIHFAKRSIAKDSSHYIRFRSYHLAAQAYAQLDQLDSSEYSFNSAPLPLSKPDSVLYLSTRAYLSADSLQNLMLAADFADTLQNLSSIATLSQVYNQYEQEAAFHSSQSAKRRLGLVAWISVLTFLSLMAVAILLRRNHLKVLNSNKNLLSVVKSKDLVIEGKVSTIQQMEQSVSDLKSQIKERDLLLAESEKRLQELELQRQKAKKSLDVSNEANCLQHQLNEQSERIMAIVKRMVQGAIVFHQTLSLQNYGREATRKRLESYLDAKFFAHLGELLSAVYPQLARRLSDANIASKEVEIVYMHFAQFPNQLICDYIGITRKHSLINKNRDIAIKVLGEGASINQIIE